jgi:hypothetical protein
MPLSPEVRAGLRRGLNSYRPPVKPPPCSRRCGWRAVRVMRPNQIQARRWGGPGRSRCARNHLHAFPSLRDHLYFEQKIRIGEPHDLHQSRRHRGAHVLLSGALSGRRLPLLTRTTKIRCGRSDWRVHQRHPPSPGRIRFAPLDLEPHTTGIGPVCWAGTVSSCAGGKVN